MYFKKKSIEAKAEGKIHVNRYNLEGFLITFQVLQHCLHLVNCFFYLRKYFKYHDLIDLLISFAGMDVWGHFFCESRVWNTH